MGATKQGDLCGVPDDDVTGLQQRVSSHAAAPLVLTMHPCTSAKGARQRAIQAIAKTMMPRPAAVEGADVSRSRYGTQQREGEARAV
eukprot:CAMPEP_0205898932 /NCGR_PEP_ID=MMETSP1083-20121108/26328_1 /ASSEMBLY_ACC=CAM_ASM_000430 /TAXON_ID=97485 /ORGANISM="Prymnesium parvum, Strain Texoma1" /LENGTH=86 /DNA_ID=CAMNT_0053264259 /DNA_START=89 /DNA_END=350 /DNA_ORIENTATION=-